MELDEDEDEEYRRKKIVGEEEGQCLESSVEGLCNC